MKTIYAWLAARLGRDGALAVMTAGIVVCLIVAGAVFLSLPIETGRAIVALIGAAFAVFLIGIAIYFQLQESMPERKQKGDE